MQIIRHADRITFRKNNSRQNTINVKTVRMIIIHKTYLFQNSKSQSKYDQMIIVTL